MPSLHSMDRVTRCCSERAETPEDRRLDRGLTERRDFCRVAGCIVPADASGLCPKHKAKAAAGETLELGSPLPVDPSTTYGAQQRERKRRYNAASRRKSRPLGGEEPAEGDDE